MNKKYQLQTNLSYYNRDTKIIISKYEVYDGKIISAVKIKYSVFEIPILIHYKLHEKENGKELKFVFGASISYNSLRSYDVSIRKRSGLSDAAFENSGAGCSGQNMTGNLIAGISTLKPFKKHSKRFYSWTLLYQKALNRAPTFEQEGVFTFNGKSYHVRSSPYLDLLSLRFTYFPFSTGVK